MSFIAGLNLFTNIQQKEMNLLCFSLYFSAGVGRTGTYIAVDIMMGLIDQSENNLSLMKLDIMGIVYQLRQDRGKMVQTRVIMRVISLPKFVFSFLLGSICTGQSLCRGIFTTN